MLVAIYAIRHVASGCCYFGSTSSPKRRLAAHRRMLRKGTHHCIHLQRAWDLYGADSFAFDILETLALSSIQERHAAEAAWMVRSGVDGRFNCAVPGPEDGMTLVHSPEAVEKIRAARLRKGKGYKVQLSDDERAARGQRARARVFKQDAIDRIRAAHVGRPISQAHKAALLSANLGRKMTAEGKARVGASKLGKKRDPDVHRKAWATRHARYGADGDRPKDLA
jgi:hypothetical protein